MIKLVAFDWNGTILSDTSAVVQAENQVLKKLGRKPISLKTFRQIFTMPIKDLWLAIGLTEQFFDNNLNQLYQDFQFYYEPKENKCRTRSGSKKTLTWLKKNDIIAIIYSNHSTPHIKKQLSRLGLSKLIDQILARPSNNNTSHMTSRGKAEKLNSLVTKLKLKPKEVISIGDTDEEIDIGHKYGYHTIALSGGYQSIKRLKSSKPNFIVHSLNQITHIIKKLNEHS